MNEANGNFNPANDHGPQPNPPPGPQPNDPFDLDALKLSQDFAANLGVKKKLLTVRVDKPDKAWFVRVHPSPDYRLDTFLLRLRAERETYLVARGLWDELATETTLSPHALFTAVTRQGVVFLWPVRLPGRDGKHDDWNRSALEAAQLAMEGWVRVTANMSLGAYDVAVASAPLPEPKWPEEVLQDLLKIAFKNYYIQDRDHPALKMLRGEA
jgi:hypothetical protein